MLSTETASVTMYGGEEGAGLLYHLMTDPDKLEAIEKMARPIDRLNELDLSTTLVVTLQRGVNDDEIGEILEFALAQPCVRGVTFQPVQVAGRVDGYEDGANRLTLSS